jgi:serine/threonine protein kinase
LSDIPEALRSALADRYGLERVIGRGGMATVYLAADLKHRRRVAVKVLRPDLAASIGTERFLKEIEIAASLTHPHIVALYDSGEADDFLYYVMPYIDGESLRTRLTRKKALSVDAAIRITVDVADALTYAHSSAVYHRDIKPENILFAAGHALVADFGIAKAITTAADASLTRTGIALGTPGYISPEQAAGIREIDARTDVYGLGCVLYEMLIGETPGMWLTDDAVRLGRFIDASAEHRTALDSLSGSIEQVLVRALAMHPDKRYASANDFAKALQEAPKRRKKYREGEVRDIIKRASELELERQTEEGALSVGGMEQAAAEVGIPPARVQEAARDLSSPSGSPFPVKLDKPSPWSWFLGRNAKIRIERVVEGEVPDDEFPVLVDEIRTSLGIIGHVNAFGRSLTWSTAPPGQGVGRNIQISISPRAGYTRIYLEESLAEAAGGLFGGMFGGGGGATVGISLGVGIDTLHAPVLAAIVAVVGASSWYLGARSIFVSLGRNRERTLADLANRLAEHIALTGSPARELEGEEPPPLLGR